MLITFKSQAYENISFFESVAHQLLTLMGHSGSIPGAIKADEVAEALANLQKGISNVPSTPAANDDNEDEEPKISLSQRAVPLIAMLQAALKKNCDVLWS